ncbi:hypothetical protein D9611_012942 [Ephemerocybe angulata]|uniref:Uncharacterized protein n=1 Tax=Ephemerocybe angulata TaxID=980116 RepID=A0A8H5FFM3_9AGAR|nr:hypothetical protein D9611_012942 [Tulosesus angulatus]
MHCRRRICLIREIRLTGCVRRRRWCRDPGGDGQDAVGAADGRRVLDDDGMASLSRAAVVRKSEYTARVEHPGTYTMPSSSRRSDWAKIASQRPFLRGGGDGSVERLERGRALHQSTTPRASGLSLSEPTGHPPSTPGPSRRRLRRCRVGRSCLQRASEPSPGGKARDAGKEVGVCQGGRRGDRRNRQKEACTRRHGSEGTGTTTNTNSGGLSPLDSLRSPSVPRLPSPRALGLPALQQQQQSATSTTTSTTTAAPTTAAPAQSTYPATPLAVKRFPTPESLAYKVDTDVGLNRGNQLGYNICNGTTEGQKSLCQTSYFNSIDDFCLWAPPEYGKDVGSIEGEMVAWCTKPGHGTRLIPAGALKGVQWMKTPDYVQAVGFIDQTFLNMLPEDWGGEMDPHGADLACTLPGSRLHASAASNTRVPRGEAKPVS